MIGLSSHEIHAILGKDGWHRVLLGAGLTEKQLSKKNGPCPVCGGHDRYHFSNYKGRGDSYCRKNCGHRDGFQLLMALHGLTFADARKWVLELAGIQDRKPGDHPRIVHRQEQTVTPIAKPTGRVLTLLRQSCAVEDCEPAMVYLDTRGLWPLPQGHGLRAHASVDYWHEGKPVGRFPALLGAVTDVHGELVTVHVTFLDPSGASKLNVDDFPPRKLYSPVEGREGCAVRLMPVQNGTMGIAEGVETAFSASMIHSVPVWAAANKQLLAKFTLPDYVRSLMIFADRDVAGLDAAAKLMERLQGKAQLSIHTPPKGDWNDVLLNGRRQYAHAS